MPVEPPRKRSDPALVLASTSPRRRRLLTDLGLQFSVRAAAVDETPRAGEPPLLYVLRLAQEKAAVTGVPGELALGADTTVVLDGELLGKPADRAAARALLRRIAGREHRVLTGVALAEPSTRREAAEVEVSRVQMTPMTEEEIAWYVGTGEPLDKAGAYGIQGLGAAFVEAVSGSYTNVVGLPLPATRRLFAALGYDWRTFLRPDL